jgi:tetratricopeptide (TPR) repeat protein
LESDRPNDGGSERRRAPVGVITLAVALAAVAAYLPALQNGYVDWDDDRYIVDNWAAHHLSWEGVRWAFTTFHEGNWTPIAWISHMADGTLFGLEPRGRHAASVVLHAGAAALLFVALFRLTRDAAPSAFAAALFAVHPVNVESVAWLAERKNVLSALFAFATLAAYAGYAARPGPGRYAVVLLLAALSLASKPALLALPLVLLLLDAWPLGRFSRRAVLEKAPLAAICVAAAALAFAAQRSAHAVVPLDALPLAARLANAAVGLVRTAGHAVWPASLSAFYPMAGTPEAPALGAAAVIGAAGLLAAITIAAIRLARRVPHLAVGWLWFLATIAPVCGLVQIGSHAMADRFAYVPLVGLFIAVAWSVPGARAWPPPLRAAVPAVLVLLALGTAAASRTGVWRDAQSLWRSVLRVYPNSRIAHTNYAVWLVQRGKIDDAAAHIREAALADPDNTAIRAAYGGALTRAGRADEAVTVLRDALRLDPSDVRTNLELARAYDALGSVDAAEEAAAAALAAAPGDAEALVLSAKALAAQGRSAEALERCERALRARPRDPAILFNIGAAQAALGRRADAIAAYERVLGLDPAHEEAHFNLANVLADEGRTDEAIAHYRTAIAMKYSHAEAHYNLALVLMRVGDRAGALAATTEALKVRGGYPEAWYNLGVLRFEAGDAAKALEAFREAARLRPTYVEAHANLAAVCAALGDDFGARAAAATARSLARAAGNEALARSLEERFALEGTAEGATR